MPLFVLAVLVGWFMPASDPVALPAADAAGQVTSTLPQPAAAPASSTPALEPQANPGEVVLSRAADGHFYAPGNADGASVSFLVDTGASVVALTEDDAERIGHYWHPGELTVIGRGANGEVQGKSIIVKHLAIGDLAADNVPAVIIPQGLHVSLLGQSYLSRIAQVTISDNQMTLKN